MKVLTHVRRNNFSIPPTTAHYFDDWCTVPNRQINGTMRAQAEAEAANIVLSNTCTDRGASSGV